VAFQKKDPWTSDAMTRSDREKGYEACMGFFKDIDDAIEELEEATMLLGAALEAEHESAEAYLHNFQQEIVRVNDIGDVRARLAREQADAQNEDLLDVWREASHRCAKLASIRLQELLEEEQQRLLRAAEQATQQRQREEARVARLKQEADDAERRRLQAERAMQDTLRARQVAERYPPTPRAVEKMATSPSQPRPAVPIGKIKEKVTAVPVAAVPAPRPSLPATGGSPAASSARSPLTGVDLKRWREDAKLSQRQAAERLGVAHGTVGKAEAVASAALPPALLDALTRAIGT
jgi:hypothetical protein